MRTVLVGILYALTVTACVGSLTSPVAPAPFTQSGPSPTLSISTPGVAPLVPSLAPIPVPADPTPVEPVEPVEPAEPIASIPDLGSGTPVPTMPAQPDLPDPPVVTVWTCPAGTVPVLRDSVTCEAPIVYPACPVGSHWVLRDDLACELD